MRTSGGEDGFRLGHLVLELISASFFERTDYHVYITKQKTRTVD